MTFALHSKSLNSLIEDLLLSCKIFSKHIVKLGIDGGGGFLKVCLGVCELEPEHNDCSPPSRRLLTSQASKDTSVKRQLLVAEGVRENYTNIKLILSLLDIQQVEFVISCDMKLANNLSGLQAILFLICA